MRPAYAVEAPYQNLVIRFEEHDARMATLAVELRDRGTKVRGESTRPDVDDTSNAGDRALGTPPEVDHRRNQSRWKVVDDEPAEVLQAFRCGASAGAGQPADDGDLQRRGLAVAATQWRDH